LDASFDPSLQTSGTFSYLLAVPAPCVNDTASVTITVVQAPNAGFDAEYATCVNGAAIDLLTLLAGDPDGTGTWSGPSGAMNGSFQPGTDPEGTYTYSVPGTTPCPNATAEITITVEIMPNAGTNGSTTVCPEAAVVDLFALLGGTPDTDGTWTDPYGASCDASFDPANDPQGTYTYTVAGQLCPNDLATATATVYVVPVPNAGPDAISCSLIHSFSATGEWLSGTWSNQAGVVMDDISSPNALATATNSGPTTFTWTVITQEGCTSQDEVTILFTVPMTAVAATSDAICHGACDGTASVQASGGNIGSYFHIWSNGIAGDVPEAIGLCAGNHSVLIADTNGCNVNVPFTIGQPVPLVIDGVISTPETCPGSCDGVLAVNDPEGVLFLINESEQIQPIFSGLCAGTYAIVMTDEDGCTAETMALVGSPQPVTAAFIYAPDTIFVDDPTVQFIEQASTNAITFNWVFEGLGTSTEQNPTLTFPEGLGGEYTVCLTAADQNGCSADTCLTIMVFDLLSVSVPNAFTPNGDGVNDVFLPIFNLPWVVDYQFLIFNRWGERIFGTDQPGKPWDGLYGGVTSKEEVYVWKLSCRDQLSGEHIERIGHVTLLK